YTHALSTLRQLLRAGTIGEPFHVAMQVHWGSLVPGAALTWRDQAAQSTAGIWADGGSHLFDALAYVLAPAQQVCAQMMIVPRGQGEEQPDSVDLANALARLRLAGSAAGAASGLADR